MKLVRKICVHALVILFVVFITFVDEVESALIDDLRSQISDRATRIELIEQEITQYQNELTRVGKDKRTLQNAVRTLNLSKKKLEADIRVTQNRISATTYQVEELAIQIFDHERQISTHSKALAESIRRIDAAESNTFIESLLAKSDFSEIWEDVEDTERFQAQLRQNLEELKAIKSNLEISRDSRKKKRRELVNYEYELDNQKTVVLINKREKDTLLTQTKNQESNYQKLLNEKVAARKEFERELLDFEARLQIIIDPNSIPSPKNGILSWPLDKITVTQYFGDTAFAKSGAYNGRGHNGVDFRASPGTTVRSPLSGTVTATGDTDIYAGCYSYGKWVLIKHNNGLSSLYAHLSLVSVNTGSQVLSGQAIGYSGNTGYSTGPHLHMGLFASQGVRLVKFKDIKSNTNCAEATVPVAPHAAYLNPLSYLPKI
ncbi:peptidoglycan DD-metalloendopeptidase family protein [Patescibacteria group bacterium]|nr:peptidoglycan DD-metalloendopeptidase family protein [Patescibacteria group bacterium]